MKNLKCAIGATILTPLIMATVFSLLIGLLWLMSNYGFIEIVILTLGAVVFIIFVIAIWNVIYEHCVEKHKGEN